MAVAASAVATGSTVERQAAATVAAAAAAAAAVVVGSNNARPKMAGEQQQDEEYSMQAGPHRPGGDGSFTTTTPLPSPPKTPQGARADRAGRGHLTRTRSSRSF